MLVTVLGYNKVEYVKGGQDRAFYKVWCADSSESGKIDFGLRTYEVLCSVNYFNKLQTSLDSGSYLHIGWERDTHRPFLYVK